MQERIVIFLNADDLLRPTWVVLDANHVVRQSAEYDHPAGLATIAADKEVIVIVPPQDVSLTRVNLPKMQRTRLLQALPYAIEEQLTDEIETLHFALGERDAAGTMLVAVVARSKMQSWVGLLQEWGIQANWMLPLTLAIPPKVDRWQVVVTQQVAVRVAPNVAFSCDLVNIATMLDISLTEYQPLPKQLDIYCVNQQFDTKNLELEVPINKSMMSSQALYHKLAEQLSPEPILNLLQGAFAPKKSRLPKLDLVMKVTVGLALGWLFLLFYGPIMSYFVLHHRVSQLDSDIATIYRHQFPQATSVSSPKLRMEEKLHKLSAQVGENRLFVLLGYIGKALTQVTGVKLQRFDFQSNMLTLDLTATTTEEFAAFTDDLTAKGLVVKQQNANLSGARVNATLQVE
jgi:general secretion pathway protein L